MRGQNGGSNATATNHDSDRKSKSSAAYAFLQLQGPLPPYELDPSFRDPRIRKRIGDVIAQAMEQRVSKHAR